jgi:hypothetical protein
MLIPPPNPLLPKMIMPDEPMRNGFFRKFMYSYFNIYLSYRDLGKRPKVFENERAKCGPPRIPANYRN